MTFGLYSARELARLVGCTRKALRVYQKHGLIQPTLKKGNRRYESNAFHRLRLIVSLRDIGLSIPDIGLLLDVYDRDAPVAGPLAKDLAAEVSDLVRLVTERIEYLQTIRHRFIVAGETLFDCALCENPATHCDDCVAAGKLDSTTRALLTV